MADNFGVLDRNQGKHRIAISAQAINKVSFLGSAEGRFFHGSDAVKISS